MNEYVEIARLKREKRRERQRRQRRRARVMALVILSVAVVAIVSVNAVRTAATAAANAEPIAPEPLTSRPTRTACTSLEPIPAAFALRAESTRDATITIIAIGDLLFDLAPKRLIAEKGGAAPLAEVADILRDADVTIANLECPLSTRGTKVAGKPDHLIFRGDPRSIDSLTTSGIDIVALANNHIMDYGAPALEDTISLLDGAGIAYAGAGPDLSAAWAPAYVERKGKTIAYISVSERIPSHFLAGSSTPGMASGRDMDRIVATIAEARNHADIVIVASHWGVEQAYECNAEQIRAAHRFIDAGADMVLSHHPHVMQAVEFYNGGLIAYSLGNFLFPYKTVEGRKSFILRAAIGPHGIAEVTAVPVYLGDWGRPTLQTGSSAQSILGKLRDVSAKRGTRVVIEGDAARLVPE